MEIIDAQLHQPGPWRQWDHDDQSLLDLEIEMTLAHMDAAGVDRVILMARPEWCALATSRHPDRLAAVVVYDETADDIAEQIAGVRTRDGFLGVRITPSWPPENIERLRAGAFDPLLSAAQEHDVPVNVFVSGNLLELEPVVQRFPSLNVIVDHLGLRQPPLMEADDPPWRDLPHLLALGQYENVSVKISGAPTLSRKAYPFEDVWEPVQRVIEAFGVQRCMWGTDQHRVFGRLHGGVARPRYAGYHSYAEGVHYLLDREWLSASDKEALFGQTLRRIMRWDPPALRW